MGSAAKSRYPSLSNGNESDPWETRPCRTVWSIIVSTFPRPAPSPKAHAWLVPAVLIAGCQDYNLNNKEDVHAGVEDSAEPDDDSFDSGTTDEEDPTCPSSEYPQEDRGVDDVCAGEPPGGFTPIVEWNHGSGQGCLSQPIVADLDQDGIPEVVYNSLPTLFNPPGQLTVVAGDTGITIWQDTDAKMAYGSPPAVGDIDADGEAEIVIVREYASALLGEGDYTVAAYDIDGNEEWESPHYTGSDFDWATAPNIRDMDKDGNPEVIAGRVILHGADGTQRGKGLFGRGSYGISGIGAFSVSESSVPAVVDIDLDGIDEVVVGNATYSPDGTPIRWDTSQDDAMVGVANFDADPEAEVVGVSFNTIRLMDTDGSIVWGPYTVAGANILSAPGIADLDQDGIPEIVTAGGNKIVVFHGDGTVFWEAAVTDESGATGASFFDFEGDGILEVVYIDEVAMTVYDGQTGGIKFLDTSHQSNTMMDYPTVADVDADGQAEIVVCNNGFMPALTVYGDQDESWRGARGLWNQHAYSITNINDDLSIPTDPTPGFVEHNTWHSAVPADRDPVGVDLQTELLEVCTDDCDDGTVQLAVRLVNRGPEDFVDSVDYTVYAYISDTWTPIHTVTYTDGVASGIATDGVVFELDASLFAGASGVKVVVDDDGSGIGVLEECDEANNESIWSGDLCE